MAEIINFFNSGFFVGAATIATGLAAWAIYVKQRSEAKQQAARVLLTEIRIASKRIQQIRDKITGNQSTDFPPVFPTNSWKSYSHLFISDFDDDELEHLNAFYDYGELIEELAKKDNNFFWVSTEERTKVTVNKIADFAIEAMTVTLPQGQTFDDYVGNKRNVLNGLLDRQNTTYTPVKTVNTIQVLLQKIPDITTSSCGTKLKHLAGLR